MMKHNALLMLLVALLAVAVLMTAGLSYGYVRASQQLPALQEQANKVQRNRTLFQSLAADSVEYSRRNPAIDPILQSVGFKRGATNSPSSR
jgi:hypothetical protein